MNGEKNTRYTQPQQSSIPLLQGTLALVYNGQGWTHEKQCALCNQIHYLTINRE